LIHTVKRYRLVPAPKFLPRLQGLDCGPCREPVLPLSAEQERQLAAELERLHFAAV